MPEGVIAVVDAMGVQDAGIFGDILCARMAKRGVTALVTDGVLRDLDGVEASGLTVWCSGMRSEVHTSDIKSLMRSSYAVLGLKKNKNSAIRESYTYDLSI